MKKPIYFILIVIATIVIIDIIVGKIGDNMVQNHKLSGDYESIEYVMTQCDEDVLILGLSVALNGLVPKIIEDSIGLSCYNGAANGQYMPFFETMIESILKRYIPKTIILGFRLEETATKGVGERYNILVPYYGRNVSILDEYLESSSKEERYLLKSNLYRYNKIWFRIFLYQFFTPNEKGKNGFIAKGVPRHFPVLREVDVNYSSTEERLKQFANIISICKENNVEIVVVFLPVYMKLLNVDQISSINDVVQICEENDIKCFNDLQYKDILEDSSMFYDEIHLNKEGAYVYTSDLINRMKEEGVFSYAKD